MLLVKADLKPSMTHGVGLFAAEPIAKGAAVYQWTVAFDPSFSQIELNHMPAAARRFIDHFGWLLDGRWYVNLDSARFINHSRRPNLSANGREARALRDIEPGEEFTEDYSYCEAFDETFAPFAEG